MAAPIESTVVKQESLGSAGLSPQEQLWNNAGAITSAIQRAQAYQEAIKATKPALIDYIGAMFGWPGSQRAIVLQNIQARQLMQAQKGLEDDLRAHGLHELVPAVYMPLGKEQIPQLAQLAMQRRQQAFSMAQAEAAPYTQLFQPQQVMPTQSSPGNEPIPGLGVPFEQRQLTTAERMAKLSQALASPETAPSMLRAIEAYAGNPAATLQERQIQRSMEMRQQQQMAPIMEQINQEIRGGGGQQTSQSLPAQPTLPASAPGQPAPSTSFQARMQAMGLNPSLVQAVLGNEGSGPQSISPAGARGRFQIMPETGAMYGASEEQLMDDSINEMVGLRYLRDLSDPARYPDIQGRPDLVLAAYFSGPRNVKAGRIVNPDAHHPSQPQMTVTRYVAQGMARMAQAQAGPRQVGQPGMQVAGEATPGPGPLSAQGLTPGQGLPPLDPFKTQWMQGVTLGPKGVKSVAPHEAKQRSAEIYIDSQLSKDPRLLPFALLQAQKQSAIPSPQRMEYYRKVYSTGAMMAALSDPAIASLTDYNQRFQAALQQGGSDSTGLFDPQYVQGFRDPVLQEQALSRMKQREQLTPLSEDVAATEARRAGERQEKVTVGGLKGEVTGRAQVGGTRTNTLQDVEPKEYHLYRSKQTGEPLPTDMPMPDVRASQAQGQSIKLTQKDADSLQKLQEAAASLEPLLRTYEQIYGPNGAFYRLSPGQRVVNAPVTLWKNLTQIDPTLTTAQRLMGGWATEVSRILGETGRLSDQDVQRAMGILPQLGAFADTAPVAKRLIDSLLLSFDRQMGVILRNRQFQDQQMFRPHITVPVNLGRGR